MIEHMSIVHFVHHLRQLNRNLQNAHYGQVLICNNLYGSSTTKKLVWPYCRSAKIKIHFHCIPHNKITILANLVRISQPRQPLKELSLAKQY